MPSPFVSTKLAPVLGEVSPVPAIRRDEVDPALGETLVKIVAIVCGVSNDAAAAALEESASQSALREE